MDYLKEIVNSIKDVVKIDSVEGPAEDGKPFGKGVYDALDFMLKLGEKFGFKSINYDGYVGEIVWGDENADSMAILCHLDVVPVGNLSDWKYPPFSATEEDGKIYGRGTMDDKGPAVICLYCMKALKDSGFIPTKTVKLILGCDEESGWQCIKHYKEVAKMPDFGFSPDADFPVLYAEKGILHAKFEFDGSGVAYVSGGTRPNVVCDYCEFQALIDGDLLAKYGLEVDNKSMKIISRGVTAHGSTPDKGKNAIKNVLYYLADVGSIDKEIPDKLFGDSLHLKDLEDETGHLTMSPDVIEKVGDKIYVTVDFRYPSTKNPDEMIKRISGIGKMEILEHQLPLFNDKNGKLIQTLLKIYNDTMHEDMQPLAIGGGTYARALKTGTAFGPQFVGEPETIHQPNEYITLNNIEKCFEMYKLAISQLL